MSDKILIPYDFSEDSKEMLQYFDSWGEKAEYVFQLLYVAKDASLLEEVQQNLEKHVAELQLRTPHEYFVKTGIPHEQIMTVYQEWHCHQIFMTAHSHTSKDHGFLGEHTDHVLHHLHCPIFVYRGALPDEVRENRIVLPIDLKQVHEPTVLLAGEWAQESQAELHLVNICGIDFLEEDHAGENEEQKAQQAMNQLRERLIPNNVSVEVAILNGMVPGELLVEYQQKVQPRLIMMVSKQLEQIESFFIGSNTDYVVRNTNTPMYIFRF